MLEVRNTELKGRGVFATKQIEKDIVVEKSPVLLLSPETSEEILTLTGLDHYCYDFDGRTAIALGFGSLFNHSDTPNCDWYEVCNTIVFITNQTVKANEEITIDYGVELWFDLK